MVDLREARRAAAKIGLGLQYVLKEARVFDIWERLSPLWLSTDKGKAQVVCKGGTSLNKIYLGPLQRFSEDIDMDIIFEQEMVRKEKIELVKRMVLPLLQPEYILPRERVMRNVLRTGTMLCAYHIWKGETPDQAIEIVARTGRGPEREVQEEALREFARYCSDD